MGGFLLKALVVAISAWLTIRFLSEEDEFAYENLLRGKNVLLTGASSGIGEEAAYYYAKLGANVVFAARREPLLKEVLAKCQELSPSGKFKYIVADFSKEETPKKLVEEALSFLGSLDYLLLNHAYLLTKTSEILPWKGTTEDYDRLKYSLDVNFLSYVKVTDAALPHLKKTNGSICVVSSMIIIRPIFMLPYAASKSAMSMFFIGLRQELKHRSDNISVTIIHLGMIPTENAKAGMKSTLSSTGEDVELHASVLPVTTPAKCAEDIVAAFTRRESEVYYPYNQMLWVARIMVILSSSGDILDGSAVEFFKSLVELRKWLHLA